MLDAYPIRYTILPHFLLLLISGYSVSLAQDTRPTTTTTTVTKTVQGPDTWTVLEYPRGAEVVVDLTPSTLIPEAEARATVIRREEQTAIYLNIGLRGLKTETLDKKGAKYRGWQISKNQFATCVKEVLLIEDGVVTKTNETCKGTTIVQDNPVNETNELNLYAIDSRGATFWLGRVAINNEAQTQTFKTPLSKFMLILTPVADLDTIAFRSAVPHGFAVVPNPRPPVGEKVGATTSPTIAYNVPMLNIPAYKKGDDTKLRVNFSGALTGARANVFITPRKDGPTEVKLRFHELKEAPAGQVFTVWAISPDNKFMKLGQIVNTAGRNEAEIRSEVALADFGLFVTLEDATSSLHYPLGPSIGFVVVVE